MTAPQNCRFSSALAELAPILHSMSVGAYRQKGAGHLKASWRDINYLMAVRIAAAGALFAFGYSVVNCIQRLPFVH